MELDVSSIFKGSMQGHLHLCCLTHKVQMHTSHILHMRCHLISELHWGSVDFWGAEGAPILFSLLGIRMASCSYILCICYLKWASSALRDLWLEVWGSSC